MGFDISVMALESGQDAIFGLAQILYIAVGARDEIN